MYTSIIPVHAQIPELQNLIVARASNWYSEDPGSKVNWIFLSFQYSLICELIIFRCYLHFAQGTGHQVFVLCNAGEPECQTQDQCRAVLQCLNLLWLF